MKIDGKGRTPHESTKPTANIHYNNSRKQDIEQKITCNAREKERESGTGTSAEGQWQKSRERTKDSIGMTQYGVCPKRGTMNNRHLRFAEGEVGAGVPRPKWKEEKSAPPR